MSLNNDHVYPHCYAWIFEVTRSRYAYEKNDCPLLKHLLFTNFSKSIICCCFSSPLGMTVVLVALTATTVSCALKRRKLKNRKKRKNDKAVKLALSNMKRMQMSSLPWSFYNR